MLYEVHIPQPGQQPPRVERVHGDNWLDALRRGLAAASLPAPTRNLACDLQDDESVIITDTGTGQIFRVQPARITQPQRRISINSPSLAMPRRRPDPHEAEDETLPGTPLDLSLNDPLADPAFDPMATEGAPVGQEAPEEDAEAPMSDPMFTSSDHSEVIRPSTLGPDPTPYDDRPTAPRVTPQRPVEDDVVTLNTEGPPESLTGHRTLAKGPAHSSEVSRLLHLDEMDTELDELRMMGRDVHDACNFTLDLLLSRVQCSAGAILLIKPHQRSFYFAAVRGPRLAAFVQQMVSLGDGIPGAALRSRRPVNMIDPAHSQMYDGDFTASLGRPPSSILCVPVFAHRKAFGMIDLIDRVGRDGFTQEDEELTTLCARRLGDHFASLLPRGRR